MHPQLETVVAEFESARQRLHRLAETVPEEHWAQRPDPDRWSIGECVAHLNLSSVAYLPLLKDGLARARQMGGSAPRRYRRDFLGWMLWKAIGPPARFKAQASAPFLPAAGQPPALLIAEFDRLQEEQIACVQAGDGLPLSRVKIVSPFAARISYNLFACLTILPRHQHRHLWQAEQVRASLRRPSFKEPI
jgi:hypothetical protein